ncbi:MAG: MGMT family protein [Candidatus Micrarchaeota archaeon]|nr:MGMT family protein [Candidatus Micrarchaeota archaeon]
MGMRERLRSKGLSDFDIRVLEETGRIARGRTRTYGEIAKRIGSHGAARAVGNALAKNPFPEKIPCHRVVAKNGIGGYSGKGGIKKKRELLAKEGALV